MGYNTTVFILNDAFDQIQKDPEGFVADISRKMHDGGDFSAGMYCTAGTVMRSEHADVFRLYVTQGNSIMELSEWNREVMRLATSDKQYLRDIVDADIARAEKQLRDLKKAVKQARAEVDTVQPV